jgi:hypothetical protein
VESGTVQADKSVTDMLTFERPLPAAKHLDIDLPVSGSNPLRAFKFRLTIDDLPKTRTRVLAGVPALLLHLHMETSFVESLDQFSCIELAEHLGRADLCRQRGASYPWHVFDRNPG